ncbi:MAG TPA: ABC transporter ATP-binding protein [Nitrospiraceae bacterium]|jgi:ABC-2 type transport system ATP-binding protein
MDIISIEGLTKEYPSGWPGRPPVVALSGLSFSVSAGEIYGFLGPNGAGKTTTLKILMGLMRENNGTARVFGYPAGDIRAKQRTGFLPESPYFYDYLTAEEFLGFYGRLAGLNRGELPGRITQMLQLVGLTDARHRQLRKFSKGMLQRVGLAQALIHEPELIVLDEPMSGLDPLGRKLIRDVILSLRDRGKTIFFSSHIIPDVEMICDRVGIIMKGKLLAMGRVDELVRRDQVHSVEVVCEGVEVDKCSGIVPLASRVIQQGRQSLIILRQSNYLERVLAEIRQQGGHLISVTPQKGTLEELFLEPSCSLSEMRG